MTTTMLLAQLLLPVFAAITISMFINPKWFKQAARGVADSPALTYLFSTLSVIGGTAVVLYHNLWSQDWAVAITLIGWISLIKGVVYILFPKAVRHMASIMDNKTVIYIVGVICAIITVILFSLSGLR